MRILFLVSSFFPKIGGVEKHVLEISKILSDKGHEIIIFTQLPDNKKILESKSYQFSTESDNEAIKLKQIDKSTYFIRKISDKLTVYYYDFGRMDWFRKFRIWKSLWLLKNIINGVDVIHCHDVFFWYLPFRFLLPSKKVFTTFHGYEDYPIPLKAVIVRKISEVLSNGNICIGDFIKKWYGTKPDIVSYGAVGIKKIRNPKSEIRNKRNNKNSAVFVGRLDEQTGILTYIDVYKIIKRKVLNFELTIVGDGEFKSNIKDKEIKMLGFKSNPIPYLISNRFAFVSRYLSILEAMSQKRLVFAVFDNPVKEDYLRMSPFAEYIIISNSPKIIADKVIYFLNNPEKEKELIENAYAWSKNQTWEKMVGNYLSLWENNLGSLKIRE